MALNYYSFTGNFPLKVILSQGFYELRIDLEDWEGEKRFAKYKIFDIGDVTESYKLTVAGYSGDAGGYQKNTGWVFFALTLF